MGGDLQSFFKKKTLDFLISLIDTICFDPTGLFCFVDQFSEPFFNGLKSFVRICFDPTGLICFVDQFSEPFFNGLESIVTICFDPMGLICFVDQFLRAIFQRTKVLCEYKLFLRNFFTLSLFRALGSLHFVGLKFIPA